MPEPDTPASGSEIVFYQTEDGHSRIQVGLQEETVWITKAQIAEFYQTTKQNVRNSRRARRS